MRHVHRGRRLGAGIALTVLASGCGLHAVKTVTGNSRPPSSASTGSFVATWLPTSVSPSVNLAKAARLTWTSPTGKTGSVAVTEAIAFSGLHRDGSDITLLAARADAYPNGYWNSFLVSPAWAHKNSNGRLILYSPSVQHGQVHTTFEDDGYFVAITADKVSVPDVVKFTSDLHFAAS